MTNVLIMTDGKAGHENQSKAFARSLDPAYGVTTVRFKPKFHKLLSYLFDWLGIYSLKLFTNEPQDSVVTERPYNIVIGTGSGTFYPAKAIAKRAGAVKCGVILYPRGYKISNFDCILAPTFDRPKKAAHVIEIPANLVANDAAFYEKGVAAFKEHAAKTVTDPAALLTRPAIAVIVGGPNKCSTMTPEWMKQQLDVLFAAANSSGEDRPQFWVTTSRRTPSAVEAVVDAYPWDYKLLYSEDHFNPIPAFVKLAKKIYVTAESTGMLSEACTFGSAHVVALDNLNPGPHKFRRFVDDLRAAGYVDGSRKIDLSVPFAAARRLLTQ